MVRQNKMWYELANSYRGRALPVAGPMKAFIAKNNLPRLERYARQLPTSYWNKWTKRTVEQLLPHKSWLWPY